MSGYSVRPYRPAWWLPGGHLQTLAGWLLRPRSGVEFLRERIDTPDGDFLDLDFAQVGALRWSELDDSAPVALVLHGLEGSALGPPALQCFRALAAHGIRGVGLNFRSCSGEPNRAIRSYHAGETSDLALVLDLLRERFPRNPLAAVGYSLGGNVLLKYLGETGAAARDRVHAAAAYSVPFDLAAGARKLGRGLGMLYTSHFIRSLQRKYQAKRAITAGVCYEERVAAARTLRDFDDAVTAPLHGFSSAAEYYASSSSGSYLSRIRVPTLILHSADDPFLPEEAIPRDAAAENAHLTLHVTRRGGHVAFVSGARPWAPIFWAEHEVSRFFALHLASAASASASSLNQREPCQTSS
ncbi:MAG TPA: alpha/beta fold hydrolase [Longimicrobiaceae bacterium]|nr:alpha/beta fold hydrolase [Longimicrobiaceae bacterium]